MNGDNQHGLNGILETFQRQLDSLEFERKEQQIADVAFRNAFKQLRSTTLAQVVKDIDGCLSGSGYRLRILEESLAITRSVEKRPPPNPDATVDVYKENDGESESDFPPQSIGSMLFEADVSNKMVRIIQRFEVAGTEVEPDMCAVERLNSEYLEKLFIDFIERVLKRELVVRKSNSKANLHCA